MMKIKYFLFGVLVTALVVGYIAFGGSSDAWIPALRVFIMWGFTLVGVGILGIGIGFTSKITLKIIRS
jgi:hypothetical protein